MKEINEVKILKILQSCLLSQVQTDEVMRRLPDMVALYEENVQKKAKDSFPRLSIDRYLMDEVGHITGLDIHDEKFGEAVFFQNGSAHYHGFRNNGKYDGK